VGGCILDCFMLSSLPCFFTFAVLLSLHLVTFLMFFITLLLTIKDVSGGGREKKGEQV